MNLFSELEGLTGEQLATAGLRLLLLRSPACKQAFVQLLDSISPFGRLFSSSHFSCYSEYGTVDPEMGRGRLDLTVELDDAVVGVEVKLAAAFQQSQPAKYAEELRKVAQHLSEIRRRPVRHFMVVLAPANRRAKIAAHLGNQDRFLEWEQVLDAFREASGGDPFVSVLISEYDRYLREHLDFLPGFASWAHHLTANWQSHGTEYHRQLLWRLRDLLPGCGGRIGAGETWIGYNFAPDGEDNRRSWIGFLPARRTEDLAPDRQAVLVVASPRKGIDEGAGYRPIELAEEVWVDGQPTPTWEVLFDGTWTDSSDWTENLAPFLASNEEG